MLVVSRKELSAPFTWARHLASQRDRGGQRGRREWRENSKADKGTPGRERERLILGFGFGGIIEFTPL